MKPTKPLQAKLQPNREEQRDAQTPGRALNQGALQRLIGYNLRRAEVEMRSRVARVLIADGMRAVEYSILSLIEANQEVTQKDLGEALSVKRPNMVSLVERLEKNGLIARTVLERDRRNHLLTITIEGKSLLARLHANLDALEAATFAHWSVAERKLIKVLLRRIYVD